MNTSFGPGHLFSRPPRAFIHWSGSRTNGTLSPTDVSAQEGTPQQVDHTLEICSIGGVPTVIAPHLPRERGAAVAPSHLSVVVRSGRTPSGSPVFFDNTTCSTSRPSISTAAPPAPPPTDDTEEFPRGRRRLAFLRSLPMIRG